MHIHIYICSMYIYVSVVYRIVGFIHRRNKLQFFPKSQELFSHKNPVANLFKNPVANLFK